MERLQNVSKEEALVIIATGKYVGEGFDCSRLDTLFLALPVSWKGIVAQYAGRLHRSFCGDFDLTLCLIDADDPADRFAVCCLDRPVCGIVFVIRNLDHSAVSSGDPSGVISGCRDICIACILLYNTIGKIPSDNAAKTAVSRDGFGRLRTAAFDCSGTVSNVCCAGFGACRLRFCRRSTAAFRSDVDPGDSSKIIQCCISEMLAERTFVDQSGI